MRCWVLVGWFQSGTRRSWPAGYSAGIDRGTQTPSDQLATSAGWSTIGIASAEGPECWLCAPRPSDRARAVKTGRVALGYPRDSGARKSRWPGGTVNRRLTEPATATQRRNQRRNDDVLRIVREIRSEVDDPWLAQWTPSRAVPRPDGLREIARDSTFVRDTSAKRAMNAIVKGLAE